MTTIRDVARLAGVGIGTVSRVMNQRSHVKMATRAKVQQAIEQLQYTPDPIARSMISRRTGSIGIIAPLFTSASCCQGVLQGMETAAARLGRQVVLYNVQNIAQRDRYFSELPMYRKVDGLIIFSLVLEESIAQKMKVSGLPIVLVDGYSPFLTSLVVNREDGVLRVVKSLLQQGHRHIGWIADLSEEKMQWNNANNVPLRFQHTWREEGFIEEYLLTNAQNREEARQALFQMLSRTDRPTAIFTTSPLLATGVLEIARVLSIKVPDALAVIDFNQSEIAEWLGLSTLQLPMDQMGEWSVRQLVDQIEKPAQSPLLHTCEVTFVERCTTNHLALFSQ